MSAQRHPLPVYVVIPPPPPPTDEGPTIHGLDTLVDHYRVSQGRLAVRLAGHYPGGPPPPHSLLHGSSNLLHRATEAGTLVPPPHPLTVAGPGSGLQEYGAGKGGLAPGDCQSSCMCGVEGRLIRTLPAG